MPEKYRIGDDMDACDLFCHYNVADLRSAGMSDDEAAVLFHTDAHDARRRPDDAPLETRWRILRKYLPFVRHTGYGRAVFITLRDIYGADDLDDGNIAAVSARIRANYAAPGLYRRLLVERCNIQRVLNQGFSKRSHAELLEDRLETNGGLMANVLIESLVLPTAMDGREGFEKTHRLPLPSSIADFRDWLIQQSRAWRRMDVVGYKMVPHGVHQAAPDDVAGMYARLAAGDKFDAAQNAALHRYLRDLLCRVAGRENMVIAVHLGIIAGAWGDFRSTAPEHWLPVLLAHRGTLFDLYHAGIPWLRVLAVIGKRLQEARLQSFSDFWVLAEHVAAFRGVAFAVEQQRLVRQRVPLFLEAVNGPVRPVCAQRLAGHVQHPAAIGDCWPHIPEAAGLDGGR